MVFEPLAAAFGNTIINSIGKRANPVLLGKLAVC